MSYNYHAVNRSGRRSLLLLIALIGAVCFGWSINAAKAQQPIVIAPGPFSPGSVINPQPTPIIIVPAPRPQSIFR